MRYVIRPLGGSGENARSCFLLEWLDGAVLLDCGVKRELFAPVNRVYPALTAEIAGKLKAVFLSHAHEDHTAALPYLYELGYRGPIFATAETLASVKGFLNKWAKYVTEGGGALPFSTENIEKLDFQPLALGTNELAGFPVQLGRSGHTQGSCWIHFNLGGHTLLYTGDLTYDGLLLQADPLPQADTVVMECAYAGRSLDQTRQYARLTESIRETLAYGGKVLLPVPANGRGCDMLLYLKARGLPICTEASIASNVSALHEADAWTRPGVIWNVEDGNYLSPADREERDRLLQSPEARIFLTPDGMLSSHTAQRYYLWIKGAPRNKIIITGHTAAGTLGNSLFDEGFRSKNSVQAQIEQITIKVHPDEEDALRLLRQCEAKQVILFHAEKGNCGHMIQRLRDTGVTCICGCGKDDFLTI